MLEVLNNRDRQIDPKNLNHMNDFWKAKLVKNQKRVIKWLLKFSYDNVVKANKQFNLKEPINYNDYLSFVNNANDLLLTKSKRMVEQLKVVHKFTKMFNDYGLMNAIYSLILTVNEYFEDNEESKPSNPREQWIHIANKYMDQMFKRYKTEYLNAFRNDKVLHDKAEDAFTFIPVTDKEVFFPKDTLEILFTFLTKSKNAKKVDDIEFNKIYLNTLFIWYYMYWFNAMMKRVIANYPVQTIEKKKTR